LLVSVLGGSAAAVHAEAELSFRLSGPPEMRVGERGAVTITLELGPDDAPNVLLTPVVDGGAIEVVRGRLLRDDARDPQSRLLTFELPVLARAPGTGAVRVHALAYRCTPRCVALEREARVSVVVLSP
jgi:hypothetical protein